MDAERWRRVEQLYLSAAELNSEHRQAFLTQACEGDKELQEEVESLLSQAPSSTELLGGTVATLPMDSLPHRCQKTLTPGLLLGPYRIEATLGAGGMGEVYRARDTRLGRIVALKLLRAGSVDAMSRLRFRREARAASALNHPNICTVYDVGECEGQPYLVMEYLEGETLRERLHRGPLPLQELLDLGIQIAAALEDAHSHGILHRDIKDANVFVTNLHDAKVLDFGIAKLMDPAAVTVTTRSDEPTTSPLAVLTEAGAAIGTVAYMSPEQARGEKLDARSDLYSLGVLLYQMASGELPFQGNTPAVIFDAILNKEPTSIHHLRPEVPRMLDSVIHSTLEKKRERRVQSGAELRAALHEVRHGLGSRLGSLHALGAWSSRRRVLLLAALLVIVLVVAGTARIWQPRFFGPKIRSLAVLPLRDASGDRQQEYFTEGMTEALIHDLARISALQVIRAPRKPARQIAAELGVDAIVDGSVRRSGDQVGFSAKVIQATTDCSLWAKNYERNVRDILILQSEVARDVASEIKVRVTPQEKAAFANPGTVNAKAYEAYLRGRQFSNRQTEAGYRKAIEEFRLSIEESPDYAPAYAGLADSYSNISWWFVPPLDVLDVAKAAAIRAVHIDPGLAEGHVSLALITGFVEWDWPAAEKELQTAISLNPGLADAHHWYAHLLEAVGRTDEGLLELKRAHELDPLSPIFDKDLALAYFYRREYVQASAQLRKILQVEPDFWRGHMTMGQVYLQKKMLPEAITELKQARTTSGFNSLASAGLAHAYALFGQAPEARRILKELEDRSKSSYVLPEAIAEIYLALGEDDVAMHWLEKACLNHAPRFAWLVKRDPNYDHSRANPGFKKLLKAMRLPS